MCLIVIGECMGGHAGRHTSTNKTNLNNAVLQYRNGDNISLVVRPLAG